MTKSSQFRTIASDNRQDSLIGSQINLTQKTYKQNVWCWSGMIDRPDLGHPVHPDREKATPLEARLFCQTQCVKNSAAQIAQTSEKCLKAQRKCPPLLNTGFQQKLALVTTAKHQI